MIERSTEVAFNERLTPEIFLMGLRAPEMVARAAPGQFVMIRVRPGLDPLLRRPFSLCGVRGDLCLVLYRVVGRGTGLMAGTRPGARLDVLGPLGRGFRLPARGEALVLVGGGMGVAPLLFLAGRAEGRPLRLLTGFATGADRVPLERVGGPLPDLRLATDDGSAGHAGPVTDLLEACLGEDAFGGGSPLSVCACGPRPMLKKVAALTRARRVSCQVSLEAAMACGLGACQGCAVRAADGRSYRHVCRDGPVFSAEDIDWTGAQAGP